MLKSIRSTAGHVAFSLAGCYVTAVLTCPVALAQGGQEPDGKAAQGKPADAGGPHAASPAPAEDADLLNDILSNDKTAPQRKAGEQASTPESEGSGTAPESSRLPLPIAELPDASATPARPAAEQIAAHSRQIEEIVVTATKREESLRDIPQSISAFTGAALENQGKLNLYDFIQESPGVVASQQSPGFMRISIRGISTDNNPASINPSPVGVFIGDTAFTDPYINGVSPDMSAFDLAGVQILKGPQGTLFGGAALSGAIRYELQEPVLGEWQFRGFSQYVSPYQGTPALTSGAAINIPLLKDDGLAFRFDYIKRNNPGVYTDVYANPAQKGIDRGTGNQVRAILMWVPADSWKLKATHLSQDYSTPSGATIADSPKGPRQSAQFVIPSPGKNSFDLDSLEINYQFDWMRVVSLSSHTDKKLFISADATTSLIGTPPPGYPQPAAGFLATVDNSSSFAQELRFQSSGAGPFQWLAGGYFYSYRLYFSILGDTLLHQGLTGPGSLISALPGILTDTGRFIYQTTSILYGYSNAKSHEQALFCDLSYKLWDRLDLSAGARFYSTSVSGGFLGTGILVLAENNGMTVDTTNSLTERGINPKFSATYHFNDEISVYSLASKGFRFGGIQTVPSTPTNGVPATYRSDSLWNYEIGLRTSWLDDTLHADITGFYIRYKNPIIQESTQGLPLTFNANVSAAISRGFEASLLWHPPVDGLTLALGGGLTDAHITRAFKAVGGVMVEPGQQMPGAARNQYNASIQYFRPLGLIDVGGDVGYTFVGKGFNNIVHSIPVNNFGSLNAGLSIGSQASSLHPRLSFNVTNILNATVPIAGTVGSAIDGAAVRQYTLTPPRTLSLRLSLDI